MPYHRRYHQDALQGYRKLSLEERGAYTTILDLIYDEGGPIENNERWLAGELNCSLRKAKVLLESLLTMKKLFINVQGKISNRRAEAELDNSLKISRKRAEVASKPRPKTDDDRKFRNKINQPTQQMQSNSVVIPEPVPDYNKIGTEYEDTPQLRAGVVSSVPPVPIDKLTGNVRLIDALEGKGGGRAAMHSLVAGVRQRGRR
jgi:uncharacterized protein YdaU (DUF1376 family)